MLTEANYTPPRPTINPVKIAKQYSPQQRREALIRYREILASGVDPENDFKLSKELPELQQILRRPANHFVSDRCRLVNHGGEVEAPDLSEAHKELADLDEQQDALKEQIATIKQRRFELALEMKQASEIEWRHRQTLNDNPILFQDVDAWVANFERNLKMCS